MSRFWASCAAVAVAAGCFFVGSNARAGIPECDNIRIEADADCMVELSGSCELACGASFYEKACATELYQVCSTDCTLEITEECFGSAEEACLDLCGVTDVTCKHNCFDECADGCQAECAGSDDVSQCRATCEATCDGECDTTCAALPAGSSCYDHCIECYNGACRAEVNWGCQQTCQDVEFESCEQALRIECDGGCEGQGALFCDGEYIIGGAEIAPCLDALVEIGLEMAPDSDGDGNPDVDLDGDGEPDVEYEDGGIDLDTCDLIGVGCPPPPPEDQESCTCTSGGDDGRGAWLGLGLLGWLWSRRRKNR